MQQKSKTRLTSVFNGDLFWSQGNVIFKVAVKEGVNLKSVTIQIK